MAYQVESANYYRLITLGVDVGSDVLRDVLLNRIHPDSVATVLQRHINTLNVLKSRRILFQEQYDLLTKAPLPDLEEFDITLLTFIFRNICNVAPVHGWLIKPVVNDLSLGADLWRLKDIRNNVFAHATSTNITSVDFRQTWVELSDVIIRISQHGSQHKQQDVVQRICTLEHQDLEPSSQTNKSAEIFLKWKEHDDKQKLIEEQTAELVEIRQLLTDVRDQVLIRDNSSAAKDNLEPDETITGCPTCTSGIRKQVNEASETDQETLKREYQSMEENLHKNDAEEDMPPVETPASPSAKRFKTVSSEDILKFETMQQSESTKRNTQWGMRIFQDWHKETYGGEGLDLTVAGADALAGKLDKFYCEAKPKDTEKRSESLPQKHAEEYHKSTLKNLRAAINHHLQDIGHKMDIVHDKEFKKANAVLDGMLKNRKQSALSRPTQHKAVIEQEDLMKINVYFNDAESSPIKLRQCVWFNIAMHFVTRGMELNHQLGTDSFQFLTDQDGSEYASLTHETQQKYFQGGLYSKEALSDKRMYATGGKNCPIKLLKLLLNKTDKNAKSLFNICDKVALSKPESFEIWYTSKPLGKTSFNSFMPDISKHAKCTKRYTAHCLRSISIQAMNDAGLEARQIMYMSGHSSTSQKKSISNLLPDVALGNYKESTALHALCPPNSSASPHPAIEQFPAPTPLENTETALQRPSGNTENANPFHFNSSVMSSVNTTAGFLSNSSFNSCTFTFNH